jgi:hypothetical protein
MHPPPIPSPFLPFFPFSSSPVFPSRLLPPLLLPLFIESLIYLSMIKQHQPPQSTTGYWKTGLPVRSVALKPYAGSLVVGWVTTSEYWLLIVFFVFFVFFCLFVLLWWDRYGHGGVVGWLGDLRVEHGIS